MTNYTHAKLVKLKDNSSGDLTEGKVYRIVEMAPDAESFFRILDDAGARRFMLRRDDWEADFELLALDEPKAPTIFDEAHALLKDFHALATSGAAFVYPSGSLQRLEALLTKMKDFD